MKRNFNILSSVASFNSFAVFLSLLTLIILSSCDNEDVLATPQGKMQQFISRYFPGEAVRSQTTLSDGSVLFELKNSATVLFDSQGQWISVDGNGVVLPAVMIYDQLPDALYNYVEEMEDTSNVYRIYRNSTIYVVDFLDSTIEYVIATGKITYVTDSGEL